MTLYTLVIMLILKLPAEDLCAAIHMILPWTDNGPRSPIHRVTALLPTFTCWRKGAVTFGLAQAPGAPSVPPIFLAGKVFEPWLKIKTSH